MNKRAFRYFLIFLVTFGVISFSACKSKKKLKKDESAVTTTEDTLSGRCRLDFKSARALSRYMRDNEFKFTWLSAKANVTSYFEEKEENFDIRLNIRKDSAMLVTIQYLLGLQVAKVLITKDSVKLVNYIKKEYFVGDFAYINDLLNADLDFDLIQAVMFGNSAEFHDEESKLKPVADRQNCRYMLSTERKKRLRRIQTGTSDLKTALQTLTLLPDNYKITTNEFIDPATNRKFIANYSNFTQKDSVYAPYNVDIEIVAQKNARVKIEYVRIEKNSAQKLSLSIPAKYDPIKVPQK